LATMKQGNLMHSP
ncbi:hypothetical protein D039_5124, partial [Vibrio parahaemolyticus EKP-028]